MPWTSLRVHGESIHSTHKCFPWGDHLWQKGTTYGAVDGPGGPILGGCMA